MKHYAIGFEKWGIFLVESSVRQCTVDGTYPDL